MRQYLNVHGICTGCHNLLTNTPVTNVSWCTHKRRPFISWQYGDWFRSRCRQELIYVSLPDDRTKYHTSKRLVKAPFQNISKYRSPGRQVTRINTLFLMEPNICELSLWNLFSVTVVVPRILGWLVDFWKICAPLPL